MSPTAVVLFRRYSLLLLIPLAFVVVRVSIVAAAAASIDLFVSPSGSDANDGSLATPFLTLARAQREVRARRTAAPQRPINVFLRRGRYELHETLEFGPTDSGAAADAPVAYQAYCDAALETSLTSVQPFPYQTHLVTPPRLLWNGNGDRAAWKGPSEPFLEMNVDREANSTLTSPLTLPPPIPVMDIGNVCVDKAVTGGASGSSAGGHTCYTGAIAACVSGCQVACTKHLERKTYSPELYRSFSHLFGKKLALEDDCVEVCALACRGCEPVVVSGAKRIAPGEITSWTVFKTVSLSGGGTASIFRADLTPFLTTVPSSADNPTIFSTLYINDVQLPRAGFPNCGVAADISASLSEFDCSYATPLATSKTNAVTYDKATFSARVAQWTRASLAEVELLPNKTRSLENLRYKIAAVDAAAGEITVGAGGAQITEDIFTRGVDLSTVAAAGSARFRVENVLEELDAPGEWYFDPTSKFLYVMPVDATTATTATMATLTLEIPLLRQLVRVSGSRENVYTAARRASSLLVETDSMTPTGNLVFRQLTFSGTQLLTSDLYERIPGYLASMVSWPMARVGAVFMETVGSVTVEYCTFEKIGGNAIVVSGESDNVSLHHNNISYVGSSGIAVLARVGAQRNSLGQIVLAHQLFSRLTNLSSNQIHHFGRRVTHSGAVVVVGATQTTVRGNLIYAFPPETACNYWITNADGSATHGAGTFGLVRGLDTVITIPQTFATSLSTAYVTPAGITSPGFDVPVIAKLIGAPECPSGSGRIGSLYGEEVPFTYTQCSGCCSVHANGAKIRVAGSGVAWADATSREVVLQPGESLELQAMSSAFFNSITDVYLGFHVVTTNQILELPSVRAKWTILTRKCQYAEQTYLAQCSGPCASSASSPLAATGCGNSNIALQMSRVGALKCAVDYEPDVASLVCRGPFESTADCDGSGVPKSHVHYECTMECFTTTCT